MPSKTYTGKQFNDLNLGPFCKVTNELEIHNGFMYKTGLNVDVVPFNPNGVCQAGGLYFTEWKNLKHWIELGFGIYIRQITIPDDALVVIESELKCKADRIILGKRWSLRDIHLMDDAFYIQAIAIKNGFSRHLMHDALDIDIKTMAMKKSCSSRSVSANSLASDLVKKTK